jgi:hypothetical protein
MYKWFYFFRSFHWIPPTCKAFTKHILDRKCSFGSYVKLEALTLLYFLFNKIFEKVVLEFSILPVNDIFFGQCKILLINKAFDCNRDYSMLCSLSLSYRKNKNVSNKACDIKIWINTHKLSEYTGYLDLKIQVKSCKLRNNWTFWTGSAALEVMSNWKRSQDN